MLGRQHSAAQAIAALETARAIFPRISFDLIYARPGQTLTEWRAELRQALDLAADHLSLYQLTIEPGTKFEAMHRRGEIILPDDDTAVALYETTAEEAEHFGLLGYEVSNYALPGSESRHNLTYWRYADYAGIGPGAHGRITLPSSPPLPSSPARSSPSPSSPLPSSSTRKRGSRTAALQLQALGSRFRGNDEDGGNDGRRGNDGDGGNDGSCGNDGSRVNDAIVATRRHRAPEPWAERVERDGHGTVEQVALQRTERAREMLLMGMRLTEGIDPARFATRTGMGLEAALEPTVLRQALDEGYLVWRDECLVATSAGRLRLDALLAAMVR
jgi:coproporphyrinogen III oxidase-like Fe-S oxidoreductase